jgi:hypothetical protein
MEEMRLLAGPKPRLLLDDCQNIPGRRQQTVLQRMKDRILQAQPADITRVFKSFALGPATEVPDSMFILVPGQG